MLSASLPGKVVARINFGGFIEFLFAGRCDKRHRHAINSYVVLGVPGG